MASPNADEKQTFKVFCKAHPNYSLAIQNGRVILAESNPSNELQLWYKEDYGTKVKEVPGFLSFALVNKATNQAIKHAVGVTHPVQLKAYGAVLDESILWIEANDLGGGFRAIKMTKNIELNLDASFKEEKSGGGGTVRTSTIGLWGWHGGNNQLWKIIPATAPDTAPATAPASNQTGTFSGSHQSFGVGQMSGGSQTLGNISIGNRGSGGS